jgi:hypothetical protein
VNIYRGIRTRWITLASILPGVTVRLYGIQIGRTFVGVIRRERDECDLVEHVVRRKQPGAHP